MKLNRKQQYKLHLKSEYFANVKRHVKLRDNFTCRFKGCGSKRMIEIHHIRYDVGGISIVYKELDYLHWLVCLCSEHHEIVHSDSQHPFNPNNPNKINIYDYELL